MPKSAPAQDTSFSLFRLCTMQDDKKSVKAEQGAQIQPPVVTMQHAACSSLKYDMIACDRR